MFSNQVGLTSVKLKHRIIKTCSIIQRDYFKSTRNQEKLSKSVLEIWQYLMYWRLEAADMLNRHIVILTE